MAGVIDAYLVALDRRLAFDTALRHRVRAEVEDHLLEAADARVDLSRSEAERQAVERFGPPRAIAARFAGEAIRSENDRTWRALALAAGAGFVAMRLRRMLLDPSAFEAAPLAAALDRYAFIAAVTIGLAGWVIHRNSLSRGRGDPATSRSRLTPAFAATSMFALVASILGGGVVALSAHRSFDLPSLAVFLLEAAMAAWFCAQTCSLARRTRAVERALKD